MDSEELSMTTASCPIAADGVLERFPDRRAELEKYLAGLDIGESVERNRSFLIQSLHKAQDLYGYLPESVQLLVANRLKLHLSEVYGVISFYSYFTDKPVGRYLICVCTGTACFVKGSGKILDEFKRLRMSDEQIYLRSASVNRFNGMIGMNFSCDGSHYIAHDEFFRRLREFGAGESADAAAPESAVG